MQQLQSATILTADLGPHVAAVTALIRGQPAAVVNAIASTDRVMRRQVVNALVIAGIDPVHLSEVLDGIRS